MTRARDVANLIGSGNYSSTTFTATAGQTAFTISHTQGFIQVFMNGLLLDETVDYTSNGSAVTLTSGAAAGDEIEVVAYNTFSVGDALPKSGGTMSGDLTISTTAGQLKLTDTDGTEQNTTIKQSGGNLFIQARDNTNNAGIVFAGNGGGNYDEHMRITSAGNVGIGTNAPVHDLQIHKATASSQARIQMTTNESGATNADGYAVAMEAGNRVYHWLYENAPMQFATNNTLNMVINANGSVTKPNQPSAGMRMASGDQGAYNASTTNGVMKPSTILHNVGNHYNNSTGLFTCPVAGRYLVQFSGNFYNSGAGSYHIITIMKNSGSFTWNYHNGMTNSWTHISNNIIISCAANDTLNINNGTQSGSGGGSDVGKYSYISYQLIG